jgi:hypothetical protein
MSKRKSLTDRLKENDNQITNKIIVRQEQADSKRLQLLKKRVEVILQQPYSYFITYTFDNESLEHTTEQQHIKKIKQTLRGASLYLINNDYGTQTDRLHYHAVASFFHLYDITKMKHWQYGHFQVKLITERKPKSIYEYIMKLTNHSLKKGVAKIWRSRWNINSYQQH